MSEILHVAAFILTGFLVVGSIGFGVCVGAWLCSPRGKGS